MNIAILNDTHAGVRGDMVAMADYQGRFYNEVFFPYLKENGITHILHLGDYFDRRKNVNFEPWTTMQGDDRTYHVAGFDPNTMLPDEDVYKPKKKTSSKTSNLENFMGTKD